MRPFKNGSFFRYSKIQTIMLKMIAKQEIKLDLSTPCWLKSLYAASGLVLSSREPGGFKFL